MTNISLIERVRALAEPLAESLGLVVWGIEFSGGVRGVLRVYVDAPPRVGDAPETGEFPGASEAPGTDFARAEEDGTSPVSESGPEAMLPRGVNIDQCGELSRLLGAGLEMEDLMSGAYILEVSSPGLERPFFSVSQLHPYIGNPVELVLFAPNPGFPGRKNFRGLLVDAPRGDGDGPIAVAPDILSAPAPEDAGQLIFNWNDVKRMRLVHIVPEPRKPGKH